MKSPQIKRNLNHRLPQNGQDKNCLRFDKHYRVNHSKNEFVAGDSHINGIESFWSFAKRRLQKFNGVSKETFYLHLKECEWRFNNRSKNLYLELLKLLRENPL